MMTQPRQQNTILFVSLSGWRGGPGRSLVTVLLHLPDDLTAVLACPSRGDLLSSAKSTGRLSEHVELPRRRGQVPDPLSRATGALVLLRWVLRHRRELLAVHANGMSELHIGAPAASLARVPIVVWFHGSEENPWDARLGKLWRRLLTNVRFAAVSGLARRRAVSSGVASSDEVLVIPNPIDPRDIVSPDRTPPCERGHTRIAYLGGVRHIKGFTQLPDLIEELADEPVSWILCDQPSDNDSEQEREIWTRIFAAGRVDARGRVGDIRKVYGTCDIVLALSQSESFSRIVAEAMLNGLPVVATDIEAHRALLGDNEAGILVAVGDTRAVASAICSLAGNPDLCAAKGAAGKRLTRELLADVVVPRLVQLYRRSSGLPEMVESRVR